MNPIILNVFFPYTILFILVFFPIAKINKHAEEMHITSTKEKMIYLTKYIVIRRDVANNRVEGDGGVAVALADPGIHARIMARGPA
jgi:hypothetical protein